MKSLKNNQNGFHHVLFLVVLLMLISGFAVWKISKIKSKPIEVKDSTNKSANAEEVIKWSWNGEKWQASGSAPECPNPLKFTITPADLSMASAVLYPGQTRGGNYKPHGGFRFDGKKTDDITVKAIMDGQVVSGARYIEMGEFQYMFVIENQCGIAYRFDHLATLSPAFQKLADTLPEPKKDDSRTTDFEMPVKVKAGDVVATSVGFKNLNNVGFDLGVYDYRKTNTAAQNNSYVSAHQNELSQSAYAVCWLDMFSTSDSNIIKNLPAGDLAGGKTSDYCQ